MDGYGWTTWTKWLGELSICVKHKPKPPMLVNRTILQTLQKGLKYKPINAHMSCRSVNAIVPLILMSMSQASTLSPTSPPFTPLGSPQMGTWWWSSQTKLGMRMPGITLVNAPWHQAHVRVKPHEIPWFSACVISCPWPPGFCQADVCCQGNCSGRVPVPKPGKLAAAKRLFMKIRWENHVPCF